MHFYSEPFALWKLSAASWAMGWLVREAMWKCQEFALARTNTKNYPLCPSPYLWHSLVTPGTSGQGGYHKHCESWHDIWAVRSCQWQLLLYLAEHGANLCTWLAWTKLSQCLQPAAFSLAFVILKSMQHILLSSMRWKKNTADSHSEQKHHKKQNKKQQ